ncbi:hypothetical protein [Lactiplantibacillus mudanjiangensis]|uniref:hypothetical protein n=2 Tax=Lactiplantibacillus mudanjiangensis TaxID=1296538 RepID=UPI0010300EE7
MVDHFVSKKFVERLFMREIKVAMISVLVIAIAVKSVENIRLVNIVQMVDDIVIVVFITDVFHLIVGSVSTSKISLIFKLLAKITKSLSVWADKMLSDAVLPRLVDW